jgi:hypothetical protein
VVDVTEQSDEDEFAEELLEIQLVGSEVLRPEVALLIGRYERAIGIIDNLIDLRLDVLGANTAAALRKSLIPGRLHDADRFALLRAMLADVDANAPIESMHDVLTSLQGLRNAAAHAADYMVQFGEDGGTVTFLPVVRRHKPKPRTSVPFIELHGHLRRLDWVTHWLQHIEMTHPAFAADSDMQRVWRDTMQSPSATPPALRDRGGN